MTEAERRLWRGLRNRQLGREFRRQHPTPPYFADFACVEVRLIIEIDGEQHGHPGADQVRDESLRSAGWRILRFWNNEVLENPNGVLETIAAALTRRPSWPPPSRCRGSSLPRFTGEGRGGG